MTQMSAGLSIATIMRAARMIFSLGGGELDWGWNEMEVEVVMILELVATLLIGDIHELL